ASKCRKAFWTVLMLTRSSAARARVVGSRFPTAHSPVSIFCLNCRASRWERASCMRMYPAGKLVYDRNVVSNVLFYKRIIKTMVQEKLIVLMDGRATGWTGKCDDRGYRVTPAIVT